MFSAALGLGLTRWTLGNGPGFNTLRVGPWTAWLQAGTQDADLYARAWLARSGDLPLGSGEGVAFWATRDGNGRILNGQCRYRIEPIAPAARWWTLTAYDSNGRLLGNAAQRYGFNSAEIARSSDGTASIAIGPEPLPGNWIPSGKGAFWLILRLYDTRISSGLIAQETVILPSIKNEGCL